MVAPPAPTPAPKPSFWQRIVNAFNYVKNNVGSWMLYAVAAVAALQGVFQVISLPANVSAWINHALLVAATVLVVAERVLQYLKLPVHTVTDSTGNVTMRVRSKHPPLQ